MKSARQMILLACIGATSFAMAADKVDQLTNNGKARTKDGRVAQGSVEKISNATADIVSSYKTEWKVVDGLKIYNGLLQRQLDNQVTQMGHLNKSIDNVALIERQIVPMMIRMIDSLEQFIKLDVPFLGEERSGRIAKLRKMMERSDVTSSEKFRRVIEGYQIEIEYGNTIEAYKGSLKLGGKDLQVDFLRVGRIALLYQTIGGGSTGSWDVSGGNWVELNDSEYKKPTSFGLKIARKEVAPDLLILPISAPKGRGE